MLRSALKLYVPAFAALAILFSCSSTKKTAGLPTRDDVKGTWVLNTITYDGLSSSDNVKITLLDEGGESCLKGSTWKFPNNGNGTYTLAPADGSCTAGDRNIVWSYQPNGGQPLLQFKRLPGGVKAKNVTDGYKFRIVSVTETSLRLQSEVAYNGKSIFINYDFTKA